MPIPLNMDGVAVDGVPVQLAHPGTRREFLRLTAAALAFPAAVGMAVQYGRLLVSPTDAFTFDVAFPGWQVTAMEAALAVAAAVLLFLAFRWLRRRYRALRDRTPHRRAILMATVLPGLFLGATVGLPADPLLSWASEHTASADAFRAHWMQMRHDLLYAPAPVPMHHPAAPPAMADVLLRPADLGADWYPSTRPDPVSLKLTGDIAASGANAQARAWMTQARRDGPGWTLGLAVFETETRFASPKQASRYVRVLTGEDHACPCDDKPGRITRAHIGDVTVWTARNSTHLWSAFASSDRVFTVTVLSDQGKAPSTSELTRPLRLAVRRAVRSS